jgi:outer membrane receptor protein involved in Fe transport
MRTRLLASSMITGIALIVAPAAAHAADATSNVVTTASGAGAVGSPSSAPISTITAAADTTATSPAAVSEIVVTGSRIPQPNLTSVSPIAQVSQQQIRLQGVATMEDLIDQLPQAVGDFGNFESNGSTGTATIDLRGLGNARTMVLINGERLAPGDPTSTDVAPDVNFIPPALVDRVEVLTGGASAVYGSDAIAGVVNFIMKTHFQGLSVDEYTSFDEYDGTDQQVRTANANGVSGAAIGFTLPPIQFPGSVVDGLRQTVTVTGGVNSPDDKGNVEFYMGYTYVQPVYEAARDYMKCGLSTNTGNYVQYCGGSSNTATGRITPTTGPNAGGDPPFGFSILGTPVGGLLPGANLSQAFNFAPLNYIQRPDQRWQAGEYSDYQVTNWMDIYSSFMFMDDNSTGAIAPSGSFFGDRIFTTPCNNPLLSAAQANTLCGAAAGTATDASFELGRRNVEGGLRTAAFDHQDYRFTLGAKGDIGDGWTYDLTGVYWRSELSENQDGYFSYNALENALNVVTNPATGKPACAAALGSNASAPTCVPYNIWSAGGVTSAAEAYLEEDAENSGYVSEQLVTLNFANGDLSKYGLKSPWASAGAGVSFGYQYREDSLATNYDSEIQSGDLAGFGGSLRNTSGNQNDNDLYGELRVPLVQDMTFAKDMEFEAGYRFADYEHGGGNNTFKVGLDWQTVPDVRLRASFERAARAPDVEELFAPDTPGLFAGNDPCAGTTPVFSVAQCVNTFQHTLPGITANQLLNGGYVLNGVTLPAFYGNVAPCPAAQCGTITGGSPNLKPEVADTYSVGVVFTPSFLKGFTFSLDYWNIKVANAIIDIPQEPIVNNCATLGNAFDCAQINRDIATGGDIFGGLGLGSVVQPLVNASSLATSGFDLQGSYRLNLEDVNVHGWGSLGWDYNGTYTYNLTTTLPDHTSYDCVALYGPTCNSATLPPSRYRHTMRFSWITPWNGTISLNWRLIGSKSLDFNTGQADLQDGNFKDTLPTDAHIPIYNYFDLATTWRIHDHINLRAGVNNIFDKIPPLVDSNSFGISAPPFGNGNTFPQEYDPLGRTFFFGLTADF